MNCYVCSTGTEVCNQCRKLYVVNVDNEPPYMTQTSNLEVEKELTVSEILQSMPTTPLFCSKCKNSQTCYYIDIYNKIAFCPNCKKLCN